MPRSTRRACSREADFEGKGDVRRLQRSNTYSPSKPDARVIQVFEHLARSLRVRQELGARAFSQFKGTARFASHIEGRAKQRAARAEYFGLRIAGIDGAAVGAERRVMARSGHLVVDQMPGVSDHGMKKGVGHCSTKCVASRRSAG